MRSRRVRCTSRGSSECSWRGKVKPHERWIPCKMGFAYQRYHCSYVLVSLYCEPSLFDKLSQFGSQSQVLKKHDVLFCLLSAGGSTFIKLLWVWGWKYFSMLYVYSGWGTFYFIIHWFGKNALCQMDCKETDLQPLSLCPQLAILHLEKVQFSLPWKDNTVD